MKRLQPLSSTVMSSPPSSACPSPVTPTMPKTPSTPNFYGPHAHPFANSKKRLEIIRSNGIDIEEEARLYDDMCFEERIPRHRASVEYERPASIFSSSESTSIWLGDNVGESLTFARDVKISGWTSVGDKDKLGGGAYVGMFPGSLLCCYCAK